MSFQDPVIGGTVLRIPAEQSPNFSIADQTGWAILQNGDAYFYNLIASGTITGSSVVVDGANGGIFVYSGAPAPGNLIVSIAGEAGTDAEGNAYPAGLNVTVGAIAGSTITGSTISGGSITGAKFIAEGANGEILGYSGTPAAGNLVFAVSPVSGSDAFGNSWGMGVTILANGADIVIGETGGSPIIFFGSGRTQIHNSSAIQVFTTGAGNTGYEQIQILGPQDSTQLDIVSSTWLSSSEDHSTVAAIQEFYHDSTGGLHEYRTLGQFGAAYPLGLTIGTAPTTAPVQGETFIANAAAAPATPTGGGALWARSGVPKWTDSSGASLSMSKTATVASSADLNTFTAETAVPGATMAVEVTGTAATIIATAHFDMQTDTSACTLVGIFRWNGADQTRQAIFAGTAVGQRANVGQTWEITGVTPGTYTAALYATCSASGAANSVKSTHTTLTVQVLEG
jgi:hypothetical protein